MLFIILTMNDMFRGQILEKLTPQKKEALIRKIKSSRRHPRLVIQKLELIIIVVVDICVE